MNKKLKWLIIVLSVILLLQLLFLSSYFQDKLILLAPIRLPQNTESTENTADGSTETTEIPEPETTEGSTKKPDGASQIINGDPEPDPLPPETTAPETTGTESTEPETTAPAETEPPETVTIPEETVTEPEEVTEPPVTTEPEETETEFKNEFPLSFFGS